MIRELLTQAGLESAPPGVHAGRCVHMRLAHASCQECVRICPYQAWRLDDSGLSLDEAICDGCGLCAAVCPEGALIRPTQPLIGELAGSPVALLSCERIAWEGEIPGRSSCLHALGLAQLLRLHQHGVRAIIHASADCPACERAPREGRDFLALLRTFNTLLESRLLDSVANHAVTPARLVELASLLAPGQGAVLSRRRFFKHSLGKAAELAAQVSNREGDGPEPIDTSALPARAGRVMYIRLPEIEQKACNGCLACSRICPHDAICHESVDQGARLAVAPDRCTGCNMCADVCDHHAVRVHSWRYGQPYSLTLERHHCNACGVDYYQPLGSEGDSGYCQICRTINHRKNLFQIVT